MWSALDAISGTKRFASDVPPLPGAVHLAIVRSPFGAGTLEGLNLEAASVVPGYIRTISADDFVDTFGKMPSKNGQPLLATARVRYQGEPVAVVAAATRRAARAAARSIEVLIEPGDVVTTIEDAEDPDAPLVDEYVGGNIRKTWTLRKRAEESGSSVDRRTFEQTYYSQSASQLPLEPHSVGVGKDASGSYILHTGTQAPYWLRADLSQYFSLPETSIVIHNYPMGGGFGAKLETKVEALAMAGSIVLDGPVHLRLDNEDLFYTISKHAARVRMTTTVEGNGRLDSQDVDVVYNGGAYPKVSSAHAGLLRAAGPYVSRRLNVTSSMCATNTIPSGAMRGAMTTQLAFAYESHMDDIATDLRIEPIEFRRRNIVREGIAYVTGSPISQVHYEKILDALEAQLQLARTSHTGRGNSDIAVGHGIGLMIKTTGTPTRSVADVALTSTGEIIVTCEAADFGQGIGTVIKNTVAETLKVPSDEVRLTDSITSTERFDSYTASSRTTFSMGRAIERASRRLLQALQEAAEDRLELSIDWTEYHASMSGDERIRFLRRIVSELGVNIITGRGEYESRGGPGLLESETAQGPNPSVHWHQGGALCSVAVDVKTGGVDLLGGYGVAYAGRVINKAGARGQLEGGFVYGIGTARTEILEYRDGVLQNPNLAEYCIPTIADTPKAIDTHSIVEKHELADAHGIGEMVGPAVAPALRNAIKDATGIRLRTLPITPEKVLQALDSLGSGSIERTR